MTEKKIDHQIDDFEFADDLEYKQKLRIRVNKSLKKAKKDKAKEKTNGQKNDRDKRLP